jgi:hypothetical protein
MMHVKAGCGIYEFRVLEVAHTFRSYRPTRWSAETDRAIERSNAIAVAMTAAGVLRKKSVIANSVWTDQIRRGV